MNASEMNAAIAGVADLKPAELVVPEWDGMTVYVRMMNAHEQEDWDDTFMNDDGTQRPSRDIHDWRSRLAALTLVDQDGARVFPDLAVGIAILAGKAAAAVQRIYDKAAEINGLRRDAVEKAEKNSAGAPGASSPSA